MVKRSEELTQPPDGGWGWIVTVGLALMSVVATGPMPSFGLIYGEFLLELGVGAEGFTTIVGVYMAGYSFICILCTPFLRRYSGRQVGLVGSVIFFSGSLFSAFAYDFKTLLVAHAVLQGIGFGIMIPCSHETFNSYFMRKRTVAMGIAQSINAVCLMVIPLMVRLMMDSYGFRGTTLLMAGFSLHSLLAMVMLRPVRKSKQHTHTHTDRRASSASAYSPEVVLTKFVRLPVSGAEIPEDAFLIDKPSSQGTCQRVLRTLHTVSAAVGLDLLQDVVFVDMLIGIAFTHFADLTFFTLQPMYLLSRGWSKKDTTTVVSVGGIGDLVARVTLMILGRHLADKNRIIFWVGATCTGISILAFMWVSDYYATLGVTALLGFFRGFIYVTLVLVFAEYFPQNLFAAALGIYKVGNGISALTFGLLIGRIESLTGTYEASFYVLVAMMSVTTILWPLERLLLRRKRRGSLKF